MVALLQALLASTILVSTLAQSVRNPFVGCFSSYPTSSGTAVAYTSIGPNAAANTQAESSPSSCANACASTSGGYTFSYYYTSTSSFNRPSSKCYCHTSYNTESQMSSGNPGSCSTYEARKLNIPYGLVVGGSCYSSNPVTGTAMNVRTSSSPGPDGVCFDTCAGFTYSVFFPTGSKFSSGTYTCYCSNSIISASPATCGPGSYFLYGPPNQLPSDGANGARRRRALTQRPISLCPAGLKACAVTKGKSAMGDEYECIDSQTELESCGGCVLGEIGKPGNQTLGIDCTETVDAALGGVTCDSGICLITHCRKGTELIDGKCHSQRSERMTLNKRVIRLGTRR